MKKKILIVSLVVNITAGLFVFYSFTSKTKSVNDTGGGYIILNVTAFSEYSISDGISILSHVELKRIPMSAGAGTNKEVWEENNQLIAKEINTLKSQGFELISSNGGDSKTNYIFQKK